MGRSAGDDFERGRQVGKYELVTRLSVGGMAELYLAFLRGPGGFKKFVALKMILPDIARDESFIKMFLDEARLTAALSHPHIGQVYELGHDRASGALYLVMEYVAGQTLAAVEARAHRQGLRLPVGFSCRVIHDACLALHSAHTFVDATGHARSIVHRDVSPANLMVSYGGAVKVIDFGIARARGRLVRTQVGTVKGTAGYMSPEQALDEPLDARSDVFSAGMVLYELLAGAPPFAELQGTQLMQALAVKDVPHLASVAPQVPAALADVVMSALTRDVAARCPSARDFARRLEAACPELFDEGRVAEWMRTLFPDTIELSRQLLESAGADEPPGPLIHKTAAALQEATAPSHPALPEEEAHAKGRTAGVLVAGAVVAALLGVAYVGLTWESAEAPVADPAMRALEDQVMPQLHMALAARDVTRARQLITSCQLRGQPCPAAQALLPQVEAEEAKRAGAQARATAAPGPAEAAPGSAGCRLDDARALIRQLDFEGATARLRACTSGTGLDPQAEQLLVELGKNPHAREALLQAQAELEAGRLSEARGELWFVPAKGVWKEPRAALEAKLRQAAVDRGGVGPKGKVVTVDDAAPRLPAPAPAPPAPRASTAEQRYLDSANEQLAQGDPGGAAATLRGCTQAVPSSAECEYRLGTTLARAGDPGGAFRAYKHFLDLARASDARVPKVRQLVRDYEASGR